LAIDRAIHKSALKDHPLLGSVIDRRYRIVELIGRGGKGLVFSAEDMRTGTHVAVKVVMSPGASESVRRLEREALLVASLRHPHVCAMLDMGWLDGVGPYIVMERLFGETLARRIRHGGPLPLDGALDLMLQVLSALDAAHSMSIVHRDIKPSNIFVTGRDGMPPVAKVLDFGYARRLNGAVSRITRPGIMVGTRRYIAPEVRLGGEGTPLSDIFACGIVFFETLTGKQPYRGKTVMQTELAVAKGERRWLLADRPDAPEALAWCLHNAMSSDPAERPQSARELYAQLRKIAGTLRPGLVLVDEDDSPSSVRRSPLFGGYAMRAPLLEDEPSSSSGRH
jgi:serine/threonine-protein kinase